MTLRMATIGDGAMATVCSEVVAGKSCAERPVEVRVWVREGRGRAAEMNGARENARYLPGVRLSENLIFEGDDARVFEGAELILAAVPTQYMRGALERLKGHVAAGAGGGVPVVSVAKGIELGTLKRPSEIIGEVLGRGRGIAALSGPCMAGELARRLPATMVVAVEKEEGRNPKTEYRNRKDETKGGSQISDFRSQSSDFESQSSDLKFQKGDELARWVQEVFTTAYLRVYRNEDLLGVELAGALKNVIAIAAGILDGMRAGNNAKAALLTRGLVEMTRLGVALGAQAETFAGLAGLGDLVTTCVSPEGRNRSFGERIGRGEKPAEVLAGMRGVVEGMPTCGSVVALARGKGIGMPICESLHGVLFEGREPGAALAELMARESKSE